MCACVCVCSPRCLADFYHSLAKVNSGNVYVYSVSCIMCVMGCRLLKSACSVMKDADFFIAHDERGRRKTHVERALTLERVLSF